MWVPVTGAGWPVQSNKNRVSLPPAAGSGSHRNTHTHTHTYTHTQHPSASSRSCHSLSFPLHDIIFFDNPKAKKREKDHLYVYAGGRESERRARKSREREKSNKETRAQRQRKETSRPTRQGGRFVANAVLCVFFFLSVSSVPFSMFFPWLFGVCVCVCFPSFLFPFLFSSVVRTLLVFPLFFALSICRSV